MPISSAPPPEPSVNAALTGVADVLGGERRVLEFGADEGGGGAGGSSSWDLTAPHPVFVVGLEALLQGLRPPKKPSAWEYLIVEGGEVRGAAETTAGNLGFAFAGFDSGWMPRAIARVVRSAGQLPAGDYQFRLLRIPAVHLTGVWFHGDRADYVVSLSQSDEPATGLESLGEWYEGARRQAESVEAGDDMGG